MIGLLLLIILVSRVGFGMKRGLHSPSTDGMENEGLPIHQYSAELIC